MTEKDLRDCLQLIREADDLAELIQRMRARLENVQGSVIGFAPKSGPSGGDRIGAVLAKIEGWEARHERLLCEYLDKAIVVEEAIDALTKPAQRRILRLRYLEGLSWEEISGRTFYSVRHCRRLHDEGMDRVTIAEELQNKSMIP